MKAMIIPVAESFFEGSEHKVDTVSLLKDLQSSAKTIKIKINFSECEWPDDDCSANMWLLVASVW
jgi:hypothetical protein